MCIHIYTIEQIKLNRHYEDKNEIYIRQLKEITKKFQYWSIKQVESIFSPNEQLCFEK